MSRDERVLAVLWRPIQMTLLPPPTVWIVRWWDWSQRNEKEAL